MAPVSTYTKKVKPDMETTASSTPDERMQDESQPPAKLSRLAIAGACLAPFGLILIIGWLLSVYSAGGSLLEADRWKTPVVSVLVLLGLTASYGTTILGWIAVSQIHRFPKRFYGLGLATFDGLFFPLLVLDGLIAAAFTFLGKNIAVGHAQLLIVHGIIALIALACMAVVDLAIVRFVWQSVGGHNSRSTIQSRPVGHAIFLFTAVAIVLVGMMSARFVTRLLARQDKPSPARLTIDQAIKAIEEYGGFVKRDSLGRPYCVNLVYDEDAQGNRRECTNTSDRIAVVLPAIIGLEELMLRGPQASDAAMLYVGQIKSLKKLYMWNACVTDRGLASLRDLQELEYVHISEAGISDGALETLATLPKLTGLALQGNRFTDQGLTYLGRMKQLRELWIGYGSGEITDAGVKHLADLKNLEVLDISGARVSEEMVQELMGNLNKLRVFYR